MLWTLTYYNMLCQFNFFSSALVVAKFTFYVSLFCVIKELCNDMLKITKFVLEPHLCYIVAELCYKDPIFQTSGV